MKNFSTSQTSWLETNEMSQIPHKNYFEELLRLLKVDDKQASWPDTFGSNLRSWIIYTIGTPLKMLSLFSGGGGLDIAFHDAGFNAVKMIEINKQYVETLQINSQRDGRLEGAESLCLDIKEFDPPENLSIDFVIGGPPCQTFSAAGRRAAGVQGLDDPRGNLFKEYVRILEKIQPKGFLFENVYGIIGAQNGKAWREILQSFETLGYNISYRILDAADYGVPQHRERLIIVGLKDKAFLFPRPTHGPDSTNKYNYHIPLLAVENVDDEKPKNVGGRYGHLLKDIPPGLNYSFYTEEMGHPTPQFAWRSKFSDLLYKADPSMPVRTIKAQGGQYTGPFHWENRPFSIGELKRLQTFPDSYTLLGNRVTKIEQIGNSVPPQLGRILAIAVLEQLFDLHLPLNIDYLQPHDELTFRQRKSQLTALYKKRAKEAITRMYGTNNTSSLNNVLLPETALLTRPVEICTQHEAYLGDNFSWAVKEENRPEHPWNIKYTIFETNKTLQFLVGDCESTENEAVSMSIEITPAQKWILPVENVYLHIQKSSLWYLTAGWKALEHYLATREIKADLVQLNGYYQYIPRITAHVKKLEDSSPSLNALLQFRVIGQVLEGVGVRRMLALEDLSNLWGISVKETVRALILLKEAGYEVRSEFTNNQIPQKHVLIPYAFPTFNPNSVQLRKLLFPEVFLQQLSSQEEPAMKNQELWPSDDNSEENNDPEEKIIQKNGTSAHNLPHLEIYHRSVVLMGQDNIIKTIWFEGKQTHDAQNRYNRIISAFKAGFLDEKIEAAKSARIASVYESNVSEHHQRSLEEVTSAVTAQRGRALVEILILQLAVKAICPEQDIRLHKGSKGNSSKEAKQENNEGRFSWTEGISMRRIDDTYIVPILRKHGLLRMNEFGAFMTRTFAENYPYTLFYKAEISGPKRKWLELIDDLEEKKIDAEAALLYVLGLLWKSSEQFSHLVTAVLTSLNEWNLRSTNLRIEEVATIIKLHINKSEARARLLEVAMHALLQASEDLRVDLSGALKALMPMRTANLKHRNFGDVEVMAGDFVVESWDAKYDNPYLSDALDVFLEKIRGKNISELTFGYVLLPEKKNYSDVDQKVTAIEEEYGIKVQIFSFDEWTQQQVMRARANEVSEESLAQAWLSAYVESLALRRETRAPIDEPTYDWLRSLQEVLVRP